MNGGSNMQPQKTNKNREWLNKNLKLKTSHEQP
jgi:hypothetical protein